MIDYTELIGIEESKGFFHIFDARLGHNIALFRYSENRRQVDIYSEDEQGRGTFVKVKNWIGPRISLFDREGKLAGWVLEVLESMVCSRCGDEWGPICDDCVESVQDEALLTYFELERLYGKESSGEVEV